MTRRAKKYFEQRKEVRRLRAEYKAEFERQFLREMFIEQQKKLQQTIAISQTIIDTARTSTGDYLTPRFSQQN